MLPPSRCSARPSRFRDALPIAALALCAGTGTSQVPIPEDTRWTDARTLTVEGLGWEDRGAPWDRLPARAEELVRPAVWDLSHDAAGVAVRFVTDAPRLDARWTLTDADLALPHMPATGVSGLDLFVRDGDAWRWAGAGRPRGRESVAGLVDGMTAEPREFLLYGPLYNGLAALELGVPPGSTLEAAPARPASRAKPIVFYGTSITQGGCASRPGACHTALLGRWLDRPVVNLGFSGNGKMEVELARLLGELDAACYVVDCLPNLQAPEVAARVEPFVRTLRGLRPDTPVLLVEDRTYGNAFLSEPLARHNAENRAALRAGYERLVADGVEGLHYLEGARLLGDDGEATVDSVHPTDLGFWRQARAFLPVLRELLGS